MKLNLSYVVGRRKKKATVTIEKRGNRLVFTKMSPFAFKDEVKAMAGWKWDNDAKEWSIEDCYRNHFQLQAMMGQPVYDPWEKPLQEFEFNRGPDWKWPDVPHAPQDPYTGPMSHQRDMLNHVLTRRFALCSVDMGLGKSFVMIEAAEQSGIKDWWWVAPLSGVKSLNKQLSLWKLDPSVNIRVFTYEGLREFVKNEWSRGKVFPQGIVFDECRKLANPKAKWTIAAQAVADNMRHKYGWDAMVVGMSGTTDVEDTADLWSQAEVIWPGFLREGSRTAFEKRIAIYRPREDATGGTFQEKICLLDDENKCKKCGEYKDQHPTENGCKKWIKSVNEIALVYERLDGLRIVQKKENCLDLPPKRYREVVVEPSASILRAARAMSRSAKNTITGLNWLRQLSDGFAYDMAKGPKAVCKVCSGSGQQLHFIQSDETNQNKMSASEIMVACEKCGGSGQANDKKRETKKVYCPKDDALRGLLAENYEHGRVCVFAAYHGSLDRCEEILLSEGWDVFQVDGRGWKIKTLNGLVQTDPLDYWADRSNPRVAFLAHPKSGGMGLTLVEARMVIYYSNSFSAEERMQSEDRVHRIGCDKNHGVEIVDIIHLESDRAVKDALLKKKKLERMSLGLLNFGDDDEERASA